MNGLGVALSTCLASHKRFFKDIQCFCSHSYVAISVFLLTIILEVENDRHLA